MYKGVYKIAEHVFSVESIYEEVHTLCQDYVSSEVPEFGISTEPSDIDYEREESEKTKIADGLDPDYVFSDDYLETLAVYRKLCKELLDSNILLIHGSCLSIDGAGYLFTAKSGTGKSTHTRNWRKLFGARVRMVNDDKPLVNVETMQIYGTPWNGKHHIGENISVTLKSVIDLTRAKDNEIHEVSAQASLERMMNQTYMPTDSMQKLKTFQLLNVLMGKLRFYVLGCNMDVDSARVAYEGLTK